MGHLLGEQHNGAIIAKRIGLGGAMAGATTC